MTSPSASPSEGEIVESDSEKATKSLPSTQDHPVDRPSRKRLSPSRSPSPYRAPRRSDYRSRSRSRSPYREDRRGKRTRDDDHYGRRDHRGYRAPQNDRRDARRPSGRNSYRDLDRDPTGIPDLRYDDRSATARSKEKRPRTISRSPPRFSDRQNGAKGDYAGVASRRADGGRDDRSHKGGLDGHSRGATDDEQATSYAAESSSKPHTSSTKRKAEKSVSFKLGGKNGPSNSDKSAVLDQDAQHSTADVEPVDEATLIEQRRKRREAIMAKHKTQSNPLLVQALTASNTSTPPSDSLPETPGSVSQVPDTTQVSPPATPNDAPELNSPTSFEFSKESDLMDSSTQVIGHLEEEEPSAADYDPTMDMQEDQLKHDHRLQEGGEIPASAYDETQNHDDQDVLIPDASEEQSTGKKQKEDFDMFGDEDMDMFADVPANKKPTDGAGAAKAVPVPTSKAIDMSMLDDWDDEEGYYKIILGELLEKRYHVQLNLGKGMFSAVVRALDQTTNEPVAIKIIRSNETMKKAALKEIDILKKLHLADPDDKKHIVRLQRSFEHKGHLCMVFESLSINLREVLKKFGRDVGINLKAVRAYAQQMFLGLSLLRKCNILHADLKPDNVLVNEARTTLKICDLGSASDASENEITPYLVSRFYRAPEIILGLPYDFGIDVWSVGCTLFELATGKILFAGRTNNQMLRAVMECRGRFSPKLLRKAQFAPLHFDDLLRFRSVERDRLSGKDTLRLLTFAQPTRDLRARLLGANARGMAEAEVKELNLFVDLLEKCLSLNPEKRCTPSEALRHPFIMRTK